jgi:hypothetical protein
MYFYYTLLLAINVFCCFVDFSIHFKEFWICLYTLVFVLTKHSIILNAQNCQHLKPIDYYVYHPLQR